MDALEAGTRLPGSSRHDRDGHRGRRRATAVLALGALSLAGAGAGCTSADLRQPASSQTMSVPPPRNPSAPEVPPPPPAPPTPEPAPAPEPRQARISSEPIVISGGEETAQGEATLAAAARAERERRREAGLPVAVITDQNLSKYATGPLIIQGGTGNLDDATPSDDTPDALAAPKTAGGKDEEYWRSQALAIRSAWRKAYDDVADLEQRAAELRRRFYAEDDGYRRDAEIKPEWDRVLDRLAEARAEVERQQRRLEQLLEAGRRAGAYPGWLREGRELEPAEGPRVDDSAAPSEPTVAPEDDEPQPERSNG